MAKDKDKEYEVSDHQLSISSLSLLFKLFRANKTDKKYRSRIVKIFTWAILTQPFQWLQKLIIWPRLRTIDYLKKPPVFVIGHWRSGTTHLHYLLSRDPQFGYLTNYQALFMRISFVGKGIMDRVLDYFMPETRPQDNVMMNAYEPAEEEQPLTTLTICSGMQTFFFPQNRSYYDKYNLFEGVTRREKRKWARKYNYMLKLISLANNGKQLLLKNPHNTSRVKELLELYPNAKFIYIHRHPFDVYRSTGHLYDKMISTQFLQDISSEALNERIIYCYTTTMQKYLKDRSLVPADQLVEISFEELEKDPRATLKKIYSQINLSELDNAMPNINAYLDSVKDYQKNEFEEPEKAVADRLAKEWKFAFDAWNYPVHREKA